MSDEVIKTEAVEEAAPATTEVENVMAQVMHDKNAPILTMRKCLEAGVHFGHQTRRWNPKMSKFIYGARNGIYIIDLAKTVERVNASYNALKSIVERGGKVLFVGTKPQSQQIVIDEAVRSGSFYITNRWLGGTLTNFRTIQLRLKRLKELETSMADGSMDKLPKKEVALLKKEYAKLQKNLEGIKEMRKLPNAIVLVDPTVEHNAVLEAHKLNIPVFAICDTSDDPDTVDFPIPSNNDATSAIKLIVGVLADAAVEARFEDGLTEIAYTVDTEAEATMDDAVHVADVAAEQHRAAVRAARKAREERYNKAQAERKARYAAKKAEAEGTKKEEAPVESKKEGE
ncbi:MAG: 30S ribosomal protein S2 [Candidatus Enteromonas sp.]|nr:30S ribosomal protein S2 [Candidatus Enteromonas sp.]